ncbi:flagellar hook-length control protein FliK [Nocardioides sp. Bht2]|uniref:flagellar hook-length control protein FliK n=1 Tax=Nocardioides sp. Bht2 TaxID=3392297 RepID=UPI0039B6DB4F
MTVQQIRAGGFGPLATGESTGDGTDPAAAGGFGALLAALVTPEAAQVPAVPVLPGEATGDGTAAEAEAEADDEGAAVLAAALQASALGSLAIPAAAPAAGLAITAVAENLPATLNDAAPGDGATVPGDAALLLADDTSTVTTPPTTDAEQATGQPAPAPLAEPNPAESARTPEPEAAPLSAPAASSGATLAAGDPAAAADNVVQTPNTAAPTAPVASITVPGSSSPLGVSVPTPLSSPGTQVAQPVVAAAVQHLATGQGTSRMTLTLQPEALGEVRVHLSVRDGVVQVRLSAVDAAAQALAMDAPELRRMLESIGATDTRVLVNDSNSGQSHLDQRGTEANSGFAEPEGRGQHADLTGPAPGAAPSPEPQNTPTSTPTRSSGLDLQM